MFFSQNKVIFWLQLTNINQMYFDLMNLNYIPWVLMYSSEQDLNFELLQLNMDIFHTLFYGAAKYFLLDKHFFELALFGWFCSQLNRRFRIQTLGFDLMQEHIISWQKDLHFPTFFGQYSTKKATVPVLRGNQSAVRLSCTLCCHVVLEKGFSGLFPPDPWLKMGPKSL